MPARYLTWSPGGVLARPRCHQELIRGVTYGLEEVTNKMNGDLQCIEVVDVHFFSVGQSYPEMRCSDSENAGAATIIIPLAEALAGGSLPGCPVVDENSLAPWVKILSMSIICQHPPVPLNRRIFSVIFSC